MSRRDCQTLKRALKLAFHRKYLPSLNASLGRDMFTAADGDSDALGFHVRHTATRMSRAEFELALTNEEQIIRTLRSCWQGTALEAVPEPLLRLARDLADDPREARASAFVCEIL